MKPDEFRGHFQSLAESGRICEAASDVSMLPSITRTARYTDGTIDAEVNVDERPCLRSLVPAPCTTSGRGPCQTRAPALSRWATVQRSQFDGASAKTFSILTWDTASSNPYRHNVVIQSNELVLVGETLRPCKLAHGEHPICLPTISMPILFHLAQNTYPRMQAFTLLSRWPNIRDCRLEHAVLVRAGEVVTLVPVTGIGRCRVVQHTRAVLHPIWQTEVVALVLLVHWDIADASVDGSEPYHRCVSYNHTYNSLVCSGQYRV